MSLNVEEKEKGNRMKNPECILCGSCVDTCPKNVIHFAWLWKKRFFGSVEILKNPNAHGGFHPPATVTPPKI